MAKQEREDEGEGTPVIGRGGKKREFHNFQMECLFFPPCSQLKGKGHADRCGIKAAPFVIDSQSSFIKS